MVLESVLYSLEILKNCENFTLSEIAQNTGLTLEQICKLNAELLLQR
ncbi:LysM peptidoglycan-binding domain-containing protein [Vibrio vulnificus]